VREAQIPINVLMRYFRVPTADLPVDYPGRELMLGSNITNISVNGAYIRTERPLAEGTELEISFRLPERKQAIRTGAVVRWRQKGRQSGMGLEFKGLRPADQRAIAAFVRAFLKRMRAR
jgi:uncharacterized protein (TIGR02266 family)